MKELIFKMIIITGVILLLIVPFSIFSQGFQAANVGPNQSLCIGEFTYLGRPAVTGHSYSWSPSTNLSSTTDAQPAVYPTTTTIYFLTEYDSATYVEFTDSVMITVNPLPVKTHFSDITMCEGVPSTIGSTAVNGLHYTWSPSAGLNSVYLSQPTVNPTTTTTYYLSITIAATGCENKDTVVVNVNPAPNATTGSDKSICYGENATAGVIPVSGNTYNWSTVDSQTIGTDSRITLYPKVSRTYFLTETINTTGCQKTNPVVISVNPLPNTNAGADQSICAGEHTMIGKTADYDRTYQWISNISLSSDTIANPIVDPSVTTTYYLTEKITSTGCKNSNEVTVIVNPLPAASTGPDKAICPGESVQIGTVPVKGNTYAWNPVKGLSSFMVSQPTALPKETTIYYLTETITATGCNTTNSVVVTVNPLPEAITGPDKNLCFGRLTEIGAEPVAGNTYNWTPETGLSIPDISQPAVTVSKTTTYTLTEVNTYTGCKNSNSVTVTVVHKPDVPTDPIGATEFCQFSQTQYTTKAVNGALDYKWTISPTNAGTTTGTDNSILVEWSENFSGTATIMVSGLNVCGASAFSIPLVINVKQTPATPVISLTKDILKSSSANGNQWFDESGPVEGAIDQTFKPTVKGYYYVIVETNDCISKPSNSINVIPSLGNPTNINDQSVTERVRIYPNPNSGLFTLQVPGLNNEPFDLTIYNAIGKMVYQRNNQTADANTGLLINIQDLKQGVYVLNLHSEKYDHIAKVVVRR